MAELAVGARRTGPELPGAVCDPGDEGPEVGRVRRYLTAYGHLTGPDGTRFDEAATAAVRRFQRFVGLTPTGAVDGPTLAAMRSPRCGVPDVEPAGAERRWSSRRVDVALLNLPEAFGLLEVVALVEDATAAWAAACGLAIGLAAEHFHGAGGALARPAPAGEFLDHRPAALGVGWYHGDHGDGRAFGGHELLHAFGPLAPHLAGDVHVNEGQRAVTWTVDRLFAALAHGLGHAIGLGHLPDPGAVMFPLLDGARALGPVDRAAARALYGPPVA